MIKRTLFFGNPYHLSMKDNQLVVTSRDTGEIKQVPIEDIGFVVLEHPHITITQSVVRCMNDNNVAVVFCDEKYHPSSMLLTLDGNNLQSEMFRDQISASEPLKKNLWKQTIEAKIANQASLLKKSNRPCGQLPAIVKEVKSGDTTNREAQAAREYWGNLFDTDFKRERFGHHPNSLLNYGYAILRAGVARALTGSGLLPTFGIHHHNRYNAYCLADDIMEPYRPYVDEIVVDMVNRERNIVVGSIHELTLHELTLHESTLHEFNLTKEHKAELLKVLTVDVQFEKVKRPLMVGLSQTTASLARCYSGEQKRIDYPILS
jgi:CRISPR-associated protein Cas1